MSRAGLVRCLEPWKNITWQCSKTSAYRANLFIHLCVVADTLGVYILGTGSVKGSFAGNVLRSSAT